MTDYKQLLTDYKQLCAELADTLDFWLQNSNLTDSEARELVQEARAALAQPEPEGPTLDEIDDLCAEHSFHYEDDESLGATDHHLG